ncbi:MAG: 4-hydroxy-tetrahydrodipicolinate synthase [Clostridiales bacterium]|nr:4-hydroxy-tetrahydrodipicolinate synthase [Clostridiales bacterium]
MSIFRGAAVALVTPLDNAGLVNYEALEELVEFQIASNIDTLVICGTTGEASTLTDDEQIEAIRTAVVKANKRVPVIAGAGSNYTDHGVELCRRSQQAGADGVMLVTPYYNKTSQKGLVEHFARQAAAIDIPVIVYNVPSRTGLNVLPKTTLALSKIPNIAGIKEASGSIVQISEIAELCGDALDIYAGNDDYIVPVMSMGGKGVISTAANIIPKDIHDICSAFFAGDLSAARDMQIKILDLVRALFCDVNPIPVKTALNLMGLRVGGFRQPLTSMDEERLEILKASMTRYGLI